MDKLYDACIRLPFDINRIRTILENKRYSPQTLSMVMLRFTEKACEDFDALICNTTHYPEKHEVLWGYIYELTELFLEYGLDPSILADGKSFVDMLHFCDFKYTGADTLCLLLENGMDPNIQYDSGSSFFIELDSDIILDISLGLIEDDDTDNLHHGMWQIYDINFHMWLAFIGYGAKTLSRNPPVHLTEGYTTDIFKKHEHFDFRIEYTTTDSDGFILHIFERDTGNEVAFL